MVDRLFAETVTRGQAGMAGTNDDNVSGADKPSALVEIRDHLLTST